MERNQINSRRNFMLKGIGWFVAFMGIIMLSVSPCLDSASAADPINWRAGVVQARGDWGAELNIWFAEEVEKRTNGRLKIDVYPGGTIGFKTVAYMDSVHTGLMEMAQTWGDYLCGTDPLLCIGAFIPTDYDLRVKAAFPALYDELSVYIEKKWPGVKVFHVGQVEPRQLFTRKKVASLPELKGLKVRSAGSIENAFYSELNASPTFITYPELYTAMERGVVDGVSIAMAGMLALKLYEVAPYLYDDVWYGAGLHLGIISKQALDSLPADIRSIVWDIARNEWPKRWNKELAKALQSERAELVKKGSKPVQWSKTDLDKYRETLIEVEANWLKSLNPEQKKRQERVWKAIEAYKRK